MNIGALGRIIDMTSRQYSPLINLDVVFEENNLECVKRDQFMHTVEANIQQAGYSVLCGLEDQTLFLKI